MCQTSLICANDILSTEKSKKTKGWKDYRVMSVAVGLYVYAIQNLLSQLLQWNVVSSAAIRTEKRLSKTAKQQNNNKNDNDKRNVFYWNN